ncbi:MAG: hypothetical protein AAB316_13900 [Bacteroidota bacterium]
MEYTKNVKRQIRELASLLYERELNGELSKLDKDFEAWRKGILSPFELSEKIHHFHQNEARELFNKFTTNSVLDMNVAWGIVQGKLKKEEVSAEVAEALARQIAFYRSQLEAG